MQDNKRFDQIQTNISENVDNKIETDVSKNKTDNEYEDNEYEDMPELVSDSEDETFNKIQNILTTSQLFHMENLNKCLSEKINQFEDNISESLNSHNNEENEEDLDKELESELNELKIDTSYVLMIDSMPICCSNSFKTLQDHCDDLIKQTVAKYMNNNNVYVSNNGLGDYSVTVSYKNSIWPIEQCVGRFTINKVKYV